MEHGSRGVPARDLAGVSIRAALPSDVEGALRLLEAVAAEGRWIATEPPVDLAGERTRRLNALAAPAEAIYVASAANEIVGEATLQPARTGVAILGMHVAAAWRRRGIGTLLIGAAIEWARERRMRRIDLAVFTHNDSAIALYEKCGFLTSSVARGALPRRNGEMWDAAIMRLRLPGDATVAVQTS